MMVISTLFLLFSLVFATSAEQEQISDCLKKCITPLAKGERSFSYVFNNFEKVCDLLEEGAYCARKCSNEDQRKFYSFTTFHRTYCIDYEEEISEHLDCIKKVAKDTDQICKDRCKAAHKVEKTASKEQRAKKECLTLECMTLCYYDELSDACPEARSTLYKINVGQVHSMMQSVHPLTIEKMQPECRNIHDSNYMREQLDHATEVLTEKHSKAFTNEE